MKTDHLNSTTALVSGASVIPELGMTFTEAAAKIADMIAEQNAQPDTDEGNELSDELYEEWNRLESVIFDAVPHTPADGAALIDRMLCPTNGIRHGVNGKTLAALGRIRAFLDVKAGQLDSADHARVFDQLRRWLELENAEPSERATEESAALARQIAAYNGAPVLGMAAKALLLWAGHPAAFDASLGKLRRPPAVTGATSEEDALLFGLVHGSLEAVPELVALVEGEPASKEEDFGAAVSAFDGAAEKVLALPLEPTNAMVDAACAATGCTPEKARAGFAAMVEAFRREAA